jgi:ATP-dependent exoDNAse (exonuclease V) beta subunit
MLALKNAHVRDQDISFQEEGHIYTIRGDKYYKSCTTWVKSFFGKFNPDEIIDKMMASNKWPENKYFGMTKQEIKTVWSENGKTAAEFGTSMHKHIEDFYNGKDLPDEVPIELTYFMMFYLDHPELNPFRTEMMIYDEDIRICGSVDMLFLNEDGTLSIYDWKFSKEIQTGSYGKKGLGPASDMNDCNTSHYSLQLNLYREILERKYGFVVRDMVLVFMHRDLYESYVKYYVSRIDMSPFLESRLKK